PSPTTDARQAKCETHEARGCSRFALRKCRTQIPERRCARLPSAPMRCRLAQPKGRHHGARLPFASAKDGKTTSPAAPEATAENRNAETHEFPAGRAGAGISPANRRGNDESR